MAANRLLLLLNVALPLQALPALAHAHALQLHPPVYVGDGSYNAWTLTAIPAASPVGTALIEAIISTDAGIMLSTNGGRNWSFTGDTQGGHVNFLNLATALGPHDGSHPVHSFGTTEAKYQGRTTPFADFYGDSPVDFTLNSTNGLVATTRKGVNVTFTGMTRPVGCIQTRCCNCPFRTDSGNSVRLSDGSLVIVFNVFLQPEHGHPIDGDGSSVVAFKANSDGLAWSFLSYVALAEDYQWSGEGPNESTLSLLADGKTLMCVIRMDAGDGHAAGKPYSKTVSTDSGRTWSKLVPLPSGVGTAKPRMVLMDPTKGPLVLVGGRPGNKVWVNANGMGGDDWVEQDLGASSASRGGADAADGVGVAFSTTSYNGVIALSSTTGIIAYDMDNKVYAVPFELV